MQLSARLKSNLEVKVRQAQPDDSADGRIAKSIAVLVGTTFLTKTADTLASPKIVLTALLQSMGASSLAISALVPLRESGALLPQIWLAGLVARYHQLGLQYSVGAVLQGLAAIGMLLSAWQLDGRNAGWAIVACLGVLSVARALCSISFKGVLGKSVPSGLRGQTTGWASSAAGVATIILSLALLVLPEYDTVGSLAVFLGLAAVCWLDVQGDIRIDPSTSPPTVYANVISTQLDLDDLAGLVGSEPDPTETASGQQDKEAADESSQSQSVLASDPIALATLASFFNGAIEYRADAIESPIWPVQSLDIRTEIQGTDVNIEPLRIGVADGDVSGSFSMSTASDPVQSELTMRIQGVNIKRLLNTLDIDEESFGILGGRLKYWLEGDSIADMAASADGGMFLLMTQGKLDALLAELAGVDLLESLTVLIDPEQSRTAINCAYLDLQSANGVSDIATLVLDTNDVVFLADGSIDFNDETVDVIIEPHPKDASILAAQTAAHIDGTLSDLPVRPGQTLYERAAAAAILAAVASPAAALLPFIEAGTGSDSAYCDGMITALDDARE